MSLKLHDNSMLGCFYAPILRVTVKRAVSLCVLLAFISTSFISPSYAQAVFNLPQPGTQVPLSASYDPAVLRGITIHPDNPLEFDFLVDQGNFVGAIHESPLHQEATKLIKYFMASMTVPEKDLWVNLSPYEKDRIVPEGFGVTEMGRDLLAQDYMLKQLTGSVMTPEQDLGRKFWDRVYKEAQEKFGTSDVPMDTFNKIWVVPQKAVLYEKGNTIIVVESRLKVMLDTDYIAMDHNGVGAVSGRTPQDQGGRPEVAPTQTMELTTNIIREVLLPAIEKEINEGKTFANLRQIYNSVILAAWYKKTLRQSFLARVYADKGRMKGIEQEGGNINQKIYDQYVAAFNKGVYNLVKEETDAVSGEVVPRKYFTGGNDFSQTSRVMTATKILDAHDAGRLMRQKVARVSTSLVELGPKADRVEVNKTVDHAMLGKAVGSAAFMLLLSALAPNVLRAQEPYNPYGWSTEDFVNDAKVRAFMDSTSSLSQIELKVLFQQEDRKQSMYMPKRVHSLNIFEKRVLAFLDSISLRSAGDQTLAIKTFMPEGWVDQAPRVSDITFTLVGPHKQARHWSDIVYTFKPGDVLVVKSRDAVFLHMKSPGFFGKRPLKVMRDVYYSTKAGGYTVIQIPAGFMVQGMGFEALTSDIPDIEKVFVINAFAMEGPEPASAIKRPEMKILPDLVVKDTVFMPEEEFEFGTLTGEPVDALAPVEPSSDIVPITTPWRLRDYPSGNVRVKRGARDHSYIMHVPSSHPEDASGCVIFWLPSPHVFDGKTALELRGKGKFVVSFLVGHDWRFVEAVDFERTGGRHIVKDIDPGVAVRAIMVDDLQKDRKVILHSVRLVKLKVPSVKTDKAMSVRSVIAKTFMGLAFTLTLWAGMSNAVFAQRHSESSSGAALTISRADVARRFLAGIISKGQEEQSSAIRSVTSRKWPRSHKFMPVIASSDVGGRPLRREDEILPIPFVIGPQHVLLIKGRGGFTLRLTDRRGRWIDRQVVLGSNGFALIDDLPAGAIVARIGIIYPYTDEVVLEKMAMIDPQAEANDIVEVNPFDIAAQRWIDRNGARMGVRGFHTLWGRGSEIDPDDHKRWSGQKLNTGLNLEKLETPVDVHAGDIVVIQGSGSFRLGLKDDGGDAFLASGRVRLPREGGTWYVEIKEDGVISEVVLNALSAVDLRCMAVLHRDRSDTAVVVGENSVAEKGIPPAEMAVGVVPDDRQPEQFNKQYQDAMALGEKHFGSGSWGVAGFYFRKALAYKPGDIPATGKIQEVSDSIRAETLKRYEAYYTEAVTQGDAALTARKYAVARFYYRRALAIKPGDTLATAKLKELDETRQNISSDKAQVGGIDLNPALFDLQIKRDGNGVPLAMDLQPVKDMQIEGFIPVIINITPVVDMRALLGAAG